MDLAERSTTPVGWGRRLLRAALALLGLALVVAAALGLKNFVGSEAPAKRQVAKIVLLPDTPPPPPPPPKEEKPPPPRDEPQPVPQPDTPKPAEAEQAADAPIKMEGEAGNGPSAFAAGTVRNEYSGGTPSTAASAATAAVDRAQERLYAQTARSLLRDAIERHLKSEAAQATAEFTLWLERDGSIRRMQLAGTGNSQLDGELDSALERTQRELRLPPPPNTLQPMRFRLTVRPQG
ncbi:MAG: TonB C-terminal domain-containing protein [Rubrivivax sp.]